MAKKKKARENKSQLIRDYLTEHPDAQNKDVAKALSKHGVKSQDVANLKTRMKASAGNLLSALLVRDFRGFFWRPVRCVARALASLHGERLFVV